jgi:hypothetical protein
MSVTGQNGNARQWHCGQSTQGSGDSQVYSWAQLLRVPEVRIPKTFFGSGKSFHLYFRTDSALPYRTPSWPSLAWASPHPKMGAKGQEQKAG